MDQSARLPTTLAIARSRLGVRSASSIRCVVVYADTRCRAHPDTCKDQPSGGWDRDYANLAAHPRHAFFHYGLPSPESNQLVSVDLQTKCRLPSVDIMLRYSNVSENDILLREKLEGYASSHSERFKIWNVLSSSDEAKERTLDPKVCGTLVAARMVCSNSREWILGLQYRSGHCGHHVRVWHVRVISCGGLIPTIAF